MEDDDHGLVGGDLVFAAGEGDGCFGGSGGDGFDVEAWGGGAEAEGFADDGLAVGELVEVLGRELGDVVAEDGVDFLAGFGDAVGGFQEVVDGGGDDTGGGAAADGHGDDFVDDLGVGEGFAGFGIFGVEHRVEHVFAVRGVLFTVVDAFLGVFSHGAGFALEFGAVDEPVEEFGTCGTFDGFACGAIHGFDHSWFLGARFEASEPSTVEAEGCGFEVEAVNFVDC